MPSADWHRRLAKLKGSWPKLPELQGAILLSFQLYKPLNREALIMNQHFQHFLFSPFAL